jgi:spore coat protein U-like protein
MKTNSTLKTLVVASALAIGLGASAASLAGSASSSFAANLTVNQSCSVSGTNLAFGNLGIITPTSGFTSAPAQSNLTLDCTAAMPVTISLTDGGHSIGTGGTGIMNGPGGAQIFFRIFQDSAHTTPWGSSASSAALTVTSTAGTIQVPVYGVVNGSDQLVSGVPAAPGAYTDTVTATLNY